jgi:hypothetical protein
MYAPPPINSTFAKLDAVSPRLESFHVVARNAAICLPMISTDEPTISLRSVISVPLTYMPSILPRDVAYLLSAVRVSSLSSRRPYLELTISLVRLPTSSTPRSRPSQRWVSFMPKEGINYLPVSQNEVGLLKKGLQGDFDASSFHLL